MNLNDLKKWMEQECLNGHSYSIGRKDAPFEGFVLDRKGDIFNWYYTERGGFDLLKTFENEEQACQFAFEQMAQDKTARSHLVGFFKSEKLCEEFCRELKEIKIEFETDRIPYQENSPRYRVFVFGCDYKKVAELKAKYEKLDPRT